MKKTLLLASALLILGGCAIEKINFDEKTPAGPQLKIEANYAATAEDGPANIAQSQENGPSRVSYNDPFDPSVNTTPEAHPAIDVVWAENDKIRVYNCTKQGTVADFAIETGGHGSRLGVFTGTNPQQAETDKLKAIYPAKEYDRYWDYVEVDVIGQKQTGNKNMDHIAQYDYMIGDVVLTNGTVADTKSAAVSFKRQIAIMKFVLTLPDDIGTPEQLVMSTANQSMVLSKNIADGSVTNASSILNLALSGITLAANEPLMAYLAALPFSLAGEDLSIKVIGSKKQYQYTASNVTKSYLAGEQYVAILKAADFTDVTPTGPVALAAPVGDLSGQWAQIGGLKVTREGTEETGIKATKEDMVRGVLDLTGQPAIDLIGGDEVELLANNNDGSAQPGGYGAFWIDWNRDGTLDNDTEAIMFPRNGGTSIKAPEIAADALNVIMYPSETYGKFTIPDNKPDGVYYGRVMRDHKPLTNASVANESVTYIDFAINYKQVDVIPEGDPIANFVAISDADVNILENDVTRNFTVKLNKRVETTPVEITLEVTTSNTGHSGTLGATTITIPVGEREGTGSITFAKADFSTVGTDDATVTVTLASVIGGVVGTDRASIAYNVKVVDTSIMIEYAFNDDYYYGEGTDMSEITTGNYYGLVFRATNGTIPEGTVVKFDFKGDSSSIVWSEDGFATSQSGFPQTLTISETKKVFIIGVWYSDSNGTLTITSETIPMTPAEGLKINIP